MQVGRNTRLIAFLALASAMLLIGIAYARPPQNAGVQDLVRAVPRHGNTLDDTFSQLRYIKTTDYGATWSSLQTAGDAGPMGRWTQQLPDFQTVVTNDNNICYVVYIDSASTPGVYSFTGPSFASVLVMAAGSNNFRSVGGANPAGWTSVGKTPNGDLFTLIWGHNASGVTTFWGVKSTNNGTSWSTPFVAATSPAIDSTATYPHLAQMNSATNVFMIFMSTGATAFDMHVGRIPVAGGAAVISTIGSTTEGPRNFYIGSCLPIAYDNVNNALYCTCWNASGNGAAIYYSANQGTSWSSYNIAYAVRYPSVSLRAADQTPFVVSNPGTGAPNPNHWAWDSFDQLGYGGGSWVSPPETLALANAPYDGVRPLLYVNQMHWWDANRGVGSNNIWGSVTPEGLSTERTTDGGAHWIDYTVQWNSRVDTISGVSATMNQMAGGTNGIAYITTSLRFAPVDTMPPVIYAQTLLTPYTSTGPYVVSAGVSENISGTSTSQSTINWMWYPADSGTFVYQAADSAHITDQATGSGTYFYTIPDTASNGHHWANGDTIWFYADATDNSGNYGYHWNQAIVVGHAYLGVGDHAARENVQSFALLGNFPNPFNPSTQISFDLPAMYRVTVRVYNMLGQQVATLVNGRPFEQGRHSLTFDGSNLSSGIYFYTISAGPYFATHKMVLLK